MSNFVQLRKKTYYAVLDVPKDLRTQLGRTKLIQSLKTHDKRQALAAVGPVIATWKQKFALARGETSTAAQAALWRAMRAKAKDPEELSIIDGLIADEAYSTEAKGSVSAGNEAPHTGETTTTHEALQFVQLAKGNLLPVNTYVDRWLADQNVKELTQYEYRRHLKALSDEFPYVQAVSRRRASEFVHALQEDGKSRDTIGKTLSAFRGYWDWLDRNGYFTNETGNLWAGLLPKRRACNEAPRRRGFTEEEGAQFLRTVAQTRNRHPDDYLIVLTLAATGMRLEEVTSLKLEDLDVQSDVIWCKVHDTKMVAGNRRIPIIDKHLLIELAARTVRGTKSDYAFPSLKTDNFGKRSRPVTKRLGRVLRGVIEDQQLVAAHGWRHRARTRLERAGVSPATCDWLIGHERVGEGLKRYSEGPSDEQLIEAVTKIGIPLHGE